MRRRAVQMIVWAVAVAIVLVGLPLAIFGSKLALDSERANLDVRVAQVARMVDRRIENNAELTPELLEPYLGNGSAVPRAGIEVNLGDGDPVVAGVQRPEDQSLTSRLITPEGAVIKMNISVSDYRQGAIYIIVLVSISSIIAFAVALFLAFRQARRLSAPLIYLAASAEQVGSGQVRPRLVPSGIEEIDLVQAELVRTSERMAGRIAAERQFAADASHQLRTPLTALSMRLEEIEMIADQDEVREEVQGCLEQVERLTGVVADLLRTSRSDSGGRTEAIHLSEVFSQQRQEWTRTFAAAERELIFEENSGLAVLSTPGSLAQTIATLIENALKYGAGTVRVTSRATANKKGVFVEVSDEGEGISDEHAAEIFTKGFSTGGSTGIGLAIAKDLIAADGGRLELKQRAPAVFSIFLNAVPPTLDPDLVMPASGEVVVGRRRRRR